ncbi:glycosyltransferase family 2 protein [Falsirhodobacter xinxiangensis]|uniref:glycosyltransferase family 2 protein n=1 Tax=Falsirhodobacter xinxiangensis TaxID=2530049 RepID=UPI0010AAC9EC|nr:glycosyltransferase family 2 protein [Rhodobacter xinxiangensis]
MTPVTFALDVLIPHYCDPDGLKRSLDSVAEQTWRGRMRVIVVDDGSPDHDALAAQTHCDAFAATTPFAVLFERNPKNLGRPRTRNRLLDLTDATHVAWLDAGDIWYPDKTARQFAHLDSLTAQGVDISSVWVTCTYDWEQHGKARTLSQRVGGDQVLELLVGDHFRAYLWTLLGTAEAFRIAGRFDERLPRLQDLDYFLRFVRGGGRIETAPGRRALCRYFKSDIGRNAAEVHACYKLILAKNAPAISRYPRALSSKLHYKANRLASRFAYSNGDRIGAARYLAEAALGSPRHALLVARNVLRSRLRAGG